ncbi:hypothetical protein FEM03_09755 [Phragmitibacter flavus]|uniref:SGNH hydrolase-type esterase domain-containing protein n=1 Tax=Phragmitibacter flavus TaxID=2576071 RepID=A0A5R8KHU2_9BACT|nr:SGNH/GDSL hydrolase family protein [Phragmitibacter flavus]TLD71179.1 hypothetical protein FEM03_09755 [Phragmitibacter flavus]
MPTIIMHTTRRLLAILALGLLPHLATAETQPTEAPPAPAPTTSAKTFGATLNLKHGDRFIFIGDSITHQCLYTQYVENFFYINRPELGIQFRNAGISGDRALDVLNRFDEDIAAFKPTIATILLGMNDGSYKDFDRAVFDTYTKGMTELLDKLDAINCRVVIMSPTMFDHQSWDITIKQKPDYAKGRIVTGYNAVLGYYGKWLQQTALDRGYGFVDLFGPLNDITVHQRKTDPAYTLVADAIHPGSHGQYVMAKSLVEQTGEAPLSIDTEPSQAIHIGKVPVRNLNGQPAPDSTAAKIIALNQKRNQEAVNPLRGLWGKQKGMLNTKNTNPAAYATWRTEFEAKRAELDAKAAQFEVEIHALSKTIPFKAEPKPQPVQQKKAA